MFESNFLVNILDFMAVLFVFVIGTGVLMIIIVYIADISQNKQAIRRNFPVVGHLRYFFEKLGAFFRQYFFAMDREELPFNRAERSWVYRAAKSIDNTIAFGSTRDLRPTGTILFANCPFPVQGEDATPVAEVTIGPYCKQPYKSKSIFNISGMSFGAISKPAVRPCRMARAWRDAG